MAIASNIQAVEEHLAASSCKLIAVSKTKPQELIMEAYNAGFRRFGENRVQELVQKHGDMPKDIEWHMIGHLQRNKVRHIAPFVSMIHGVDNMKLLLEINKQGARFSRKIPCLLQVHIAQEDTKFGFTLDAIPQLLSQRAFAELSHVQVKGLMGMATFTSDTSQIRTEFKQLAELFQVLLAMPSSDTFKMEELSMGMSNDYKIALEEGSTMVRIGSDIFGIRN